MARRRLCYLEDSCGSQFPRSGQQYKRFFSFSIFHLTISLIYYYLKCTLREGENWKSSRPGENLSELIYLQFPKCIHSFSTVFSTFFKTWNETVYVWEDGWSILSSSAWNWKDILRTDLTVIVASKETKYSEMQYLSCTSFSVTMFIKSNSTSQLHERQNEKDWNYSNVMPSMQL